MGEMETENPAIPVLDHGFIRMVDHMGDDRSVVRAARVSYNAAWRAGEDEGSDARLTRYLMREKHTLPFEHVVFTFEVKAPIFVLRQWMRHRTWSFSELSARYRELPDEFYVPTIDAVGVQSKSSKQAREIGGNLDADERQMRAAAIATIERTNLEAFDVYRWLIQSGWPRELARTVLPLATYSHMFATVDLLNLFKFLTLRLHPHAQWEIRQYASAMLDLIRPVAPVCVAAWEEGRA